MSTFTPDILVGTIIKTRVRLARNLDGYPFKIDNQAKAKEIIKKIYRALVQIDNFDLYFTSKLSNIKLQAMKESHLISQTLIDNKECGAVAITKDESVSIMINEEDVLREQCLYKGLMLKEAYQRLDRIDDELSKELDFAFDKKFGYLTACPTNLGTGLRASVMLFLPALTESGKIMELCQEVEDLGLTIRGVYGEGSNNEGCMYQVSNEVTLGVSEGEILRKVEDTVMDICLAERDEMELLYAKNDLKTLDKALKSYGVLTNAVMLSYGEFLTHVANVKLGAMLGLVNISDIDKIDDLIVLMRDANLIEYRGKNLSNLEQQMLRAELVAKTLKKIKE